MESKFNYHFEFKPEAPDVGGANFQRYTVDKGVNSSRTVQFVVEGQQEAFVDLSQCYLETTFRVVNENGTDLAADAAVFPTEDYGNGLWSQVGITLNNTPLPSGNDYSYTARLIDLIGANPEVRRDVLGPLAGVSGIHYGGSRIAMARADTYALSKDECAASKAITVSGRIHSDFLMTCSQLLPSQMQLGITLTRNKDNFMLCREDADTGSYKVEIVSASLFVKRVHLNAAAKLLMEKTLSTGGKLLYQRLHTITLPCAQGTKTWSWHNCFNNIAPRRVFLALVSQEAYHGSWSRTSHYLESAQVSSVRFCQDGREIMAAPLGCSFRYEVGGKVSHTRSRAKSAFAGLCRVIGTYASPRQHVGITYANFLDSCTIFAVDLDHADGLGPVPGTFDVHIDFETSLREPMMILVMGEYPKTITFDANRHITEM
jgi:hypothetical protein